MMHQVFTFTGVWDAFGIPGKLCRIRPLVKLCILCILPIFPSHASSHYEAPLFIGGPRYRTTLFPCKIDSAIRLVMTGLR